MLRRSLGLIALSALVLLTTNISVEAAPRGTLSTFDTPEGEIYFAVRLESGIPMDPKEGRDILVLFDTSASQTGAYLDDARAALDKLLAGLGPKDRVKLVAVDLDATNLTEDFVSPAGAEMRMARDKLRRRVPLGSTDMLGVIAATTDAFMFDGGNPRAAIYIGDGMSRANLLTTPQFASVSQGLVERRVSFSSFIVGPSRGMHLLAALANHTGGMVAVDTAAPDSGTQAGVALSHWAHGTVAWPTAVTYSAGLTEVLPTNVPPLRSDRDSILIGKLTDRSPQSIDLTVEVAGKSQNLKFNLLPEKSNPDVSFLPRLIEMVRADGGMSLPTVGSLGLTEAGRVLLKGAEALTQLGSRALATGDTAAARRLADEAIRNDPGNPAAMALRGAAGGTDPGLTLGPAPAGGVAAGAEGDLLGTVEAEGFLLSTVEGADRIIEERIELEVENGLKAARNKMGGDSQGAKDGLKLLLEQVEKAPRLDGAVRLRLRTRIESAIREASQRAYAEAEARTVEEANQAAAAELERINQELLRKEQKISQLSDRFNSLMNEGRYLEATDQVAVQVRELIPNDPQAESMVQWSRNRGNVVEMAILREVRHRKFVDALFQTEKAHVPFPDEPPIVYPDPEVWEELTIRRKKYASVDLDRRGGSEQKIFDQLDGDTTLEFIETPLSDVVEYLEDLHGIQIELDTRALDGVGIGSDTPITRNLKGVSLRSALRLMLKDLDLTYVVKDEVLQITTPEEAEANLVTKVYPVGDLVLPISNQAGANPFMLGGGLGGMGGFGGGLGGFGGMMGGGFCMGGFCMGGFGMGFMDVEDDLRLEDAIRVR